jgi:hypothetical protein
LNKYCSLKRLIEELTGELRILESTTMESIGFTYRLNMRNDFETWQRKEYTILPPFVEAARGYKHDDNRFRTTKPALTNPEASYIFHGINRIHSSDNARLLSEMVNYRKAYETRRRR